MSDPSQRVAIVGIGGVFPGALDLEGFWQVVARGADATGEVPPGRWRLDPESAFDPRPATPDRVYSTRGGFVSGFRLDPEGLDLDPDLVARLDPMFHLALHAGRAAWRDCRTEPLDRSRVGVVFGNIVLPTETTSALTWETLGRWIGRAADDPHAKRTEPLNRHAAGLPAGLLAQALGLGAGAWTLDAACASSLYALKFAVDELRAGRVDAMLTGGLSRPDPLYTQMGFSQLRALSPTGRARPFDARGDGLVVGEGCGMFVLKRLDDALRHGDHVHGIVAGVGLSNDVDGGLLAPSSEGQLRAMRAAYREAGWRPDEVDLIECHATGTPVGDAVELDSLLELWSEGTAPGARCVIGSHKGNFGHTLTASSAAGLIRVLLSLRHRVFPPTANFEQAGPKLDSGSSPFRVLERAEPWPERSPGRPRRAAVSGFGFGGINAHALIEEWVADGADAVQERASGAVDPDSIPVAIVGLGAHAGPFRGLRAFQERVLGGETSTAPAPAASGRGPRTGEAGYFIESLEVPLDRFRIPPRELEEMLPQQTLALLAASDAIADARWGRGGARPRAGVFVGIGLDLNTTNFHLRWGLEAEAPRGWSALRDAAGPPLTANRTMGALGGLIASRIAREYRIGGPSFSVSSEESSGPRALEVGVRLLQRGELDEAVVGAVDLTGDARVALLAERAGIGPVIRGDGAVALVLKRLDDAIRDGDRVHAVISAARAASGTAIEPSRPPSGSAATFEFASERAAEQAGGTAARVGHMGAASGLFELVGAVVALHQQVLPPSPAAREARFWLRDRVDGPRAARVAGTGLDGVRFEVELEEFERDPPAWAEVERVQPLGALPLALFAAEADDAAGLLGRLEALEAMTLESTARPVEALARRWWSESPARPDRRLAVAIVARDVDDLRLKLAAARHRVEGRTAVPVPGEAEASIHLTGDTAAGREGLVALVYPGIGNHFAGMGRALSARWPEVFRTLDAGTLRLRGQLATASAWDGPAPGAADDHRAPILGQIVVGMAVTDLLDRFGVRPDAVIGYSLGESAALFATRAWDDRDLMHDRLDASPLFRTELAGPCEAARRVWGLGPDEAVDWSAVLVAAPVAAVRAAIADRGLRRVYPLIVNTPGETVVGGQRGPVDRLVETLGCLALPLPVVSTVHCEIARDVGPAYRALHQLETTPPRGVRYYTAAAGRSYRPDRESAATAIVDQAMDTVDFASIVRRAHDDGVRVFLEAGPGGSCTRMVRRVLADRPHVARAVCADGEDAVAGLLDLLARLIAERVPVDLQALHERPTRAVGLDGGSEPDSRKRVRIPTGTFPDQPPDLEAQTAPRPREERPEVPDSKIEDRPAGFGNGHVVPAPITLPVPGRSVSSSDVLSAQVVATAAAEAEAHGAFLHFQQALGESMAHHLAAQFGLIEAIESSTGLGPGPVGPAPAPIEHPAVAPRPAPVLDRDLCLEFAVGSIGRVLGERYAAIDAYPTRVRLPNEPLMLVDRITAVEGEPLSMTSGRVVTEHDVLPGDWYLDGGKAPPCIAIESGQADLFLSAWLGVDLRTKGLAVYRLLDAAVTFHRGLPAPGDVIQYDIRISHFFHQGETILFRFEFDGTVDGAPLLTMRDGCAGFFSAGELAAGQGVVRRPLDLRPMPGKRPDDWRPLVPMAVEALDDGRVDALRRGDYQAAFGSAFAGLGLADPLRLPGGRMALVHRVEHLDPSGGRYGLGSIRSVLDIQPDDWFLTCHFVDDQVMPGTLMYECCLHALRVYLLRMGWVGESAGVSYEPVPGVSSRLRCRGQVTAATRSAVFEVVIKELGYGPEPYAIADAMMYADGKAIVEVADMTLRLAGLTREAVERVWRDRAVMPEATAPPLVFDRARVLAFATGKPSDAFGPAYRPFDEGRFVARLPAPPYSFLDRVVASTAEPLVMKPGGTALAEFDAPRDAWFLDCEGGVMPFAVLQEISLQACGWLAAHMGSALTSEHDLAFRNLGGEAVVLADVTPSTGTLSTRVQVTRVSNSGGMVLQHYDFETSSAAGPVYRGSTYFGFFRRAALADQVGIREAAPYRLTDDERRRGRSFAYPDAPPYPRGMIRMIDRIEAFVADGGPHGLGVVEGALDVDPAAWFFQAHFQGDPVCPGSLGLESLLQLLKVVALARWDEPGASFEPVAHGSTHRWLYRGQVVPGDRAVAVQAVVTSVDEARRQVTADGFLSVDGRLIYQMNGFSVRLRGRG